MVLLNSITIRLSSAFFFRILDGNRTLASGFYPEQVEDVAGDIDHEMAVGDPEAPDNFPEVNPLQEIEFGLCIYFFNRYRQDVLSIVRYFNSITTMAVTIILAKASGSRNFQPKFINWS